MFRSYLSHRKQVVVVDGYKSNFRDVKAGVPLLWILYAQDIIEDIESEILLFADDTCIFANAKDPTETAAILNRDLAKISEWARRWKVSFNPSKILYSQIKISSIPLPSSSMALLLIGFANTNTSVFGSRPV